MARPPGMKGVGQVKPVLPARMFCVWVWRRLERILTTTAPGWGDGVGMCFMTKEVSFDSWMKAFIVGGMGEDMLKVVWIERMMWERDGLEEWRKIYVFHLNLTDFLRTRSGAGGTELLQGVFSFDKSDRSARWIHPYITFKPRPESTL